MNIQQSLSAPTLENVQNVRPTPRRTPCNTCKVPADPSARILHACKVSADPSPHVLQHLQSLCRPLAAHFARLQSLRRGVGACFARFLKPFFKAVFEEAEHTFLHFGGGLSENKTNFGGELINYIVKFNPL